MPGHLRVIAGTAGGLHLEAPPHARPTTDRVREAVFSALTAQGAIEDAVVLDLFAGSGAFAIEALSRGAARAVLVDQDRGAVVACELNLETTGFSDRAEVKRSVISGTHPHRAWSNEPFDLVFCDPPYSMPDVEVAQILAGFFEGDDLGITDRALVVVERPGPAWDAPPGWSASWQRKYGDTLVTILHVSD